MRAVLVVAAVACSPPGPPAERAPSKPLPAPSPTTLPLVPDGLVAELGPATSLIVLDPTKATALLETTLPPVPCLRALGKSLKLVVFAKADRWRGFIDGLPEQATRACFDELSRLAIVKTTSAPSGYQVDAGDASVLVTWRGNLARIEQVGALAQVGNPPPPRIMALAAQVPANALAYLIVDETQYATRDVVVWLTEDDDHLRFNGSMVGEPRATATWLERLTKSVRTAASKNGVDLPLRWYTTETVGNVTRFNGEIPRDALPH